MWGCRLQAGGSGLTARSGLGAGALDIRGGMHVGLQASGQGLGAGGSGLQAAWGWGAAALNICTAIRDTQVIVFTMQGIPSFTPTSLLQIKIWHDQVDRIRDNHELFREAMGHFGEQQCISYLINFAGTVHSMIDEKFGAWQQAPLCLGEMLHAQACPVLVARKLTRKYKKVPRHLHRWADGGRGLTSRTCRNHGGRRRSTAKAG